MYNYASDPLLLKLNKVLKGLTYFRLPTSGPYHPLFGEPKPVEEKLTILGFVDTLSTGPWPPSREPRGLGSTEPQTQTTRSAPSWP